MCLLGTEVTGEIVELPSGNHNLKVGDRVAIDTVCSGRACFDCRYCNYGTVPALHELRRGLGRRFRGVHHATSAWAFSRLAMTMDWTDGALVRTDGGLGARSAVRGHEAGRCSRGGGLRTDWTVLYS